MLLKEANSQVACVLFRPASSEFYRRAPMRRGGLSVHYMGEECDLRPRRRDPTRAVPSLTVVNSCALSGH